MRQLSSFCLGPTFAFLLQFAPAALESRIYTVLMMTKPFSKLVASVLSISLFLGLLSGCGGLDSEPVAVLMSDVVTGSAPLEIGFNLSFSHHTGNEDMHFELDFGDGSNVISGIELGIIMHHTYEDAGR